MSFIFASLKGITRKENKDNIAIIEGEKYKLYAIFDGVSSAEDGKKATILAKKYIQKNHYTFLDDNINLNALMFNTNEFILSKQLKSPYTTYCIVLIPHNSKDFFYSSMGDSRIYTLSKQFMEPITTDDILAENIVTKFLGNDSLTGNDFKQKIQPKDENGILLCTDGFYKILESHKLLFFEIFQKKALRSIKQNILTQIKNNNQDDATFIFIK